MQALDRELCRPPRGLTVELILLATNLAIEGNLALPPRPVALPSDPQVGGHRPEVEGIAGSEKVFELLRRIYEVRQVHRKQDVANDGPSQWHQAFREECR